MTIRLTESRLRQIIRQEINEMGAPLVSSDPEGSISEPSVKGLRYQSAAAMKNAEIRLLEKLSTTKHPKSPSGRSYGVTIILGMTDPKYQLSALKMFNEFAAKIGLNHPDDDSIKRTAWMALSTDPRTNVIRPGAIQWSRT